MNSVVVYSWMTKALELSGNSLLVFSYIFSNLADQFHPVSLNLSDISDWFGISYRSVTYNVDHLIDLGYVSKTNDKENTHRMYKINVDKIASMCIDSDKTSYTEFIESYKDALLKAFPDDRDRVLSYISEFISQNSMYDIRMDQISCLSTDCMKFSNFDEAIKSVRKMSDTMISSDIKDNYISQSPEKKKLPHLPEQRLFVTEKKKRGRGRPSKKQALMEEKTLVTEDFVLMRLEGNEQLRELLLKFLNTSVGEKYTTDQWKAQLENMVELGITYERMIDGVSKSYMSGYKTLYFKPQYECEMREKMHLIDDYCADLRAPDSRLKEALNLYIFETQKGKSFSKNQLNAALKKLSLICITYEEKVESVLSSHEHGYAALAYPKNQDEVDMDKKNDLIDEFIDNGYYYLVDDFRETLSMFVNETQSGKSMSFAEFSVALNNLREFCFDDNDKVSKIRSAIQFNRNYFATEDFTESNKLRSAHESRKERADKLDRSRKQRVIEYAMKHSDDPRVSSIVPESSSQACSTEKTVKPAYL